MLILMLLRWIHFSSYYSVIKRYKAKTLACICLSIYTCKDNKKNPKLVSSDTHSWYFVTFLLASLDSFLFTFAHLLQPSCHGCEHLHRVILDLEKKKKKKGAWLVAWSPSGICSPAPKVIVFEIVFSVCVCFHSGYEMVRFTGVVCGWGGGSCCRYWSGGWIVLLTC